MELESSFLIWKIRKSFGKHLREQGNSTILSQRRGKSLTIYGAPRSLSDIPRKACCNHAFMLPTKSLDLPKVLRDFLFYKKLISSTRVNRSLQDSPPTPNEVTMQQPFFPPRTPEEERELLDYLEGIHNSPISRRSFQEYIREVFAKIDRYERYGIPFTVPLEK